MSRAASGQASYGLRIECGTFVMIRRESYGSTTIYSGPDLGEALQAAVTDNNGPLFLPLLMPQP